ncbi:PepSY domain-containing protein [Kosmotoga sp. DU53]|nr:PepSY domain-containing protein [Kosmotoga sp. DU53]
MLVSMLLVANFTFANSSSSAQTPSYATTQTADDDTKEQVKNEESEATEANEQSESVENTEKQAEVQEPSYTGSVMVSNPEPKDLSTLAKISKEEAANVVMSSYPSANIKSIKLENENGFLVYGVILDNGQEVKVDAGTAKILHVEDADSESENIQEEMENE